MRKLLVILLTFTAFSTVYAQETSTAAPKKKTFNLGNRAGDHFMLQLGANFLTNLPDSISSHVNGFNRSANAYIMLDKPFKNNPRFSIGVGVGIGTANIYFDKMNVEIASVRSTLPFVTKDTGNYYKKYKLSLAYAEVPLELRFTGNPETPNKSWKGALGIKIGTLINAHTKGKKLSSSAGAQINGATVKEATREYFNTTRFAATARVGYGIFSLFGSYNITGVFKDNVAPDTKLVQIGLTISGL